MFFKENHCIKNFFLKKNILNFLKLLLILKEAKFRQSRCFLLNFFCAKEVKFCVFFCNTFKKLILFALKTRFFFFKRRIEEKRKKRRFLKNNKDFFNLFSCSKEEFTLVNVSILERNQRRYFFKHLRKTRKTFFFFFKRRKKRAQFCDFIIERKLERIPK